jgi:hypothetical protein
LPTPTNGYIYSIGEMTGTDKGTLEAAAPRSQEKARTILAVVAASVISLVVWGLIVALNVR